MIVNEIVTEGVTQIWGRKGNKAVRKYRCTSGSRKGRIVSKPSTCNAPKRVKSSIAMKRAKARRSNVISIRTKRTKTMSGSSRRVANLNKRGYKPSKPKRRSSSRRRKIK